MHWKTDTGERRFWHQWFAWFPVWGEDGYAYFLETVERRWDDSRLGGYIAMWVYRGVSS